MYSKVFKCPGLRGPRKQGVNYADCAALIEYAGGRSAYFPPSLVGSDSVAPPLILGSCVDLLHLCLLLYHRVLA